ncbi:MepB family protein [Flavobacterium sp.]|uniref:MepB family protein n=1 Tax=Flavobacterium sp. TaxID=239 RepID=UPI00286AA606|nr:MepB family protein [Flavobacterium sp.]
MNSILKEVKELIFDICDFELSNIQIEKESLEYCAHQFEINNQKVVFRLAKITPTKIGQFVTLWKRKTDKSPIEPFEISDPIDLFAINVKTESRFGQFIFPKAVLIQKGIVTDKKEGKRAIRVYPFWDLTENKQAQKTQKWQLDYFLEIPFDGNLDVNRAKLLYSKKIKD